MFTIFARLPDNTRFRCAVYASCRIDAIRWMRLTFDLKEALVTAVVKQ